MKNKINKNEYACNSYKQENQMCKKCKRNLGFYNKTHNKWKTYIIEENNICSGFMKK